MRNGNKRPVWNWRKNLKYGNKEDAGNRAEDMLKMK